MEDERETPALQWTSTTPSCWRTRTRNVFSTACALTALLKLNLKSKLKHKKGLAVAAGSMHMKKKKTFNCVYYSWKSVAVTSESQCRTWVSKFIWNKAASACLRVCESKCATTINIYTEIIILLQTVPAGNEYLKFRPHLRQRVQSNGSILKLSILTNVSSLPFW